MIRHRELAQESLSQQDRDFPRVFCLASFKILAFGLAFRQLLITCRIYGDVADIADVANFGMVEVDCGRTEVDLTVRRRKVICKDRIHSLGLL